MKKIVLVCGRESITTLCEGVSSHKWDEATVHRIAKRGRAFVQIHEGKAERIVVKTNTNEYLLAELTDSPLP